jgi:peptidoglycan/LPS O-acetylase OafA/YrhL
VKEKSPSPPRPTPTCPARATAELPEPRSPRYESLTLWRGVACLLVVVYHSIFTGYARALPQEPGVAAGIFAVLQRFWIGVPLFFVISGYCVTASADALRRRGKPGVSFFWRRFRRIYPPYWVWFGVAAACVFLVEAFLRPGFFATALVPNPSGLAPWQWFGNLTLTESWRWHVTGGAECAFLSPSWTLCYEEQFYALVGLALLFLRRWFFGAFALLTGVIIAGLFLFPWLGLRTEGLFLDGQWLMFAAGMLVYYALNYAPPRATGWFCLPLGLGALCAAAPPEQLLVSRVNGPSLSYLVAFGFALLILVLRRWDAPLVRARVLRPFRFCGEMCYSLYLVHWPVVTVVGWLFDSLGVNSPAAILLVTVPACVAGAVGLARGFHLLIERRFLNAGAGSVAGRRANEVEARQQAGVPSQ